LDAADISNDGMVDILVCTPDTGEILLIYEPNDPVEHAWFTDTVYLGSSAPSYVSLQDLDGTGIGNPVWSSFNDGHIRWMDLQFSYITDIGIDIGADSSVEFSKTGVFDSSSDDFDISTGLTGYMAGPKDVNTTFTDIWGNDMVEIPVELTGQGKGGVVLNDLIIKYRFFGHVKGREDRPLENQLNNLIAQSEGKQVNVSIGVSTSSQGEVELGGLDIEYNGPPKMVQDLPDSVTILEEGKEEHLLDLSPLFLDDYLPTTSLIYDIESNEQEDNIFVRVNDGHWLSVDATGAPDWTGSFEVMLNVKDDIQNKVVFGPLTVDIENVNDEPTVVSIPLTKHSIKEDSFQNDVLDLSVYFIDVDGDDLYYAPSLSDPNEHVSVRVTSNDHLIIDASNDYNGDGLFVSVKCDDDEDLSDASAEITFILDVVAVNDAPFWKAKSLQINMDEDGSFTNRLDLIGYVDDIDNDLSDLEFLIDTTPAGWAIDIASSSEHAWLNVAPQPDFHGDSSFFVSVNDPDGLASSIRVWVDVGSVNDIPTVEISSVVTGDVVSGNVMLSGYASDIEDEVFVELKIDGQGYSSDWFLVSEEESWGYMWKTEGLTDGLYVISARSNDGLEDSVPKSVGVILRNNPISPILDSDGDSIPDYLDPFPSNPFEWEDSDGDGHGDNHEDKFPNNPNEWEDTDGDGIGDNSDPDPFGPNQEQQISDPGPFGDDDTYFGLTIPWIIAIMAGISGILVIIFGTEVGFVTMLYSLVFLYSKLSQKKVEDHEVRGLIRGYILANPGDHYSSIKKKLNLNNGTLAYHLKILEEREYIRSRRDGIYKRYYPMRMRIDPHSTPLSTQEMILNLIIENPGVSRRDVARGLEISRQVVNYHTKVLVNSGLITYKRDNGATVYYVVEES
jgi:predicted transcriptional regulator